MISFVTAAGAGVRSTGAGVKSNSTGAGVRSTRGETLPGIGETRFASGFTGTELRCSSVATDPEKNNFKKNISSLE